ncbi:MAG: aminotransferase class I/II-fold pyridoxal phosphate-dependent enzyme, partial [Melioribacteraceae bacterium]|nr:aminotransferase class I/II-fold pyridoxal phosphate-dependent enzyme [Melioribacteraceae bacterium]
MFFHKWLSKDQPEPLNYDLGEKSGKRECIITSGGSVETLRIFLHALSRYMVELPATILLFNKSIPNYLKDYSDLKFENINGDGEALINSLEELGSSERNKPVFVILGTVPNEQIRRSLRSLSLVNPLFFVEMNDAPNHLSLAREAKMKNRMLRFLTPSIFSENLRELSTVFVAGNAEFLRVIETLHFQLKGTPSSTEIELLNFLTNQSDHFFQRADQISANEIETWEGIELNIAGSQKKFHSINSKLFELGKNIIDEQTRIVGEQLNDFQFFSNNIIEKSLSRYNSHILPQDDFYGDRIEEILGDYFKNLDSIEWLTKLSQSFQVAFIKEHPEYKFENCSVISGSSRTALGLLGFYCGIEEVITCDLSWTYEDCFPKVTVVPLSEDLELDIELIKSMVERKILADPDWRKIGGVVLNNPHNASGKIFSENKIEQLLLWLLEKGIYIIDDLAYQNVLPAESLKGPKTLKQMALELYNKGYLTKDQLTPLITVHSLSKTDCFAGARLAVTEILD